MLTRMNQMDAVSNNIANINTKGFKREELFWNELDKQSKIRDFSKFQAQTHIPYAGATIDFKQGALAPTGNTFDVAISGEGLFSVESNQGEAYTRDGRFTLNNEGILVTIDGLPVLGEGGQIQIDLQATHPSQVIINDQGDIVVDGAVIDKLKLIGMDDPANFRKMGANLFQLVGGDSAPPETVSVRQGFLEESNVEPVYEMVRMMEIFHFYETGQKMIHEQDKMLNKAVNDIGRVG